MFEFDDGMMGAPCGDDVLAADQAAMLFDFLPDPTPVPIPFDDKLDAAPHHAPHLQRPPRDWTMLRDNSAPPALDNACTTNGTGGVTNTAMKRGHSKKSRERK